MKDNFSILKSKKNEIVLYGLIFTIFVAIGLWLYFDLARARERILRDRSQIALEQSKFMSQWLRTLFLSSDYVLRDVREKVNPTDLAQATPEKIEQINSWLGEKVATVSGLSGIGIYDSNLIYRADNIPEIIGFRTNQKMPSDQSDDKVSFQYMPMEKSANKRPTILLNRASFSKNGKIVGGVVAAIDLMFAQEWIQSFKIGDNDVLALVDEEGTLLARNPKLPEDHAKKTSVFQEQFKNYSTLSSVSFISESSIDGINRIYGITKMEELPLIIVVGYDLNNALEEWSHRAWQILCGLIVLMGVALFALWSYIKNLRHGEVLLKLATIDSLTGIPNRRVLFETGIQEVNRIKRYGGYLSILLLDIDHFKKVNDTYGHSSGDRVIQVMAQTISSCLRNIDMVGRIGGEEFVVLLMETGKNEALLVAERIRLAIQDTNKATNDDGYSIRFTASIGLVDVVAGETFKDALDRADEALYRAKESGRNQIIVS